MIEILSYYVLAAEMLWWVLLYLFWRHRKNKKRIKRIIESLYQ